MPDVPIRRFQGSGRLLIAQPVGSERPLTVSPWALNAANGEIRWVGSPEAAPPADETVDLGEALVTPGLVDAHSHPVYAGDRAGEAAARLSGERYTGGGILRTVASTRAASDRQLAILVEARLRTALRGGTTTLEAKSGYGLSLDEELRALRTLGEAASKIGLRMVRTFLGAHAVPAEAADADAYLRLVVDDMLPVVTEHADACDVFCDAGFFSLDQARTVLTAARSHGLQLRMHADQLARTGAAELGVELGAASVDHLEQLDDAGVRALARSETVATLLPGPALAMRARMPPARALIDAGATVALASDANAGTYANPSMAMVIGLGATLLGMTVEEAVLAATAGGAASLHLHERCGTLRRGLAADLVAWDAEHEGAFVHRLGAVHPSRIFLAGTEMASGA
jgi:imidazolonepropionase